MKDTDPAGEGGAQCFKYTQECSLPHLPQLPVAHFHCRPASPSSCGCPKPPFFKLQKSCSGSTECLLESLANLQLQGLPAPLLMLRPVSLFQVHRQQYPSPYLSPRKRKRRLQVSNPAILYRCCPLRLPKQFHRRLCGLRSLLPCI